MKLNGFKMMLRYGNIFLFPFVPKKSWVFALLHDSFVYFQVFLLMSLMYIVLVVLLAVTVCLLTSKIEEPIKQEVTAEYGRCWLKYPNINQYPYIIPAEVTFDYVNKVTNVTNVNKVT